MNPLWLLFFWRPFRRFVGLLFFVCIVLIIIAGAHSETRYTQQGKDCVVSSNGSARVAHNTKCPEVRNDR